MAYVFPLHVDASLHEDVPDVAEYLMQCVCSDQLNIQLKGVAWRKMSMLGVVF